MAIPQPPAPEAAPQGSGGSATELVSTINEQLMKLAEVVGGSDATGDEDKAKLAAVIQAYQGFVDGLGAPAGPGQGAVPMEAGTADVRPVM